MFSHQHYVPILKWKQGEYQALFRVGQGVKDRLTPLLEVPPIGFDFETGENRESIDDHLSDFGRRLRLKWQARACFVDLKYIPASTRMSDGKHYVDAIFETARAEGCRAIPVVSLLNDDSYKDAASRVVELDSRGICLRIYLADVDRQDLSMQIDALLRHVHVSANQVDLIVDLEASNFAPVTAFARTVQQLIGMIPMLNRWRSFTVAGTSYPQTIANVQPPFQHRPRREWELYEALVTLLGSETRLPTFGDYTVAHPDLVELDMRLIKPFAKLRYTTSRSWHIGRGTPVRTHGFGQFRRLCQDIVDQHYFDGASFSAGDGHIAACASRAVPTGNLTTWVWVSTNRHLTKAVADVANFHGS